jgi:hypothetical protein
MGWRNAGPKNRMPMENEVLYAFVVSTLHARHTSSYS